MDINLRQHFFIGRIENNILWINENLKRKFFIRILFKWFVNSYFCSFLERATLPVLAWLDASPTTVYRPFYKLSVLYYPNKMNFNLQAISTRSNKHGINLKNKIPNKIFQSFSRLWSKGGKILTTLFCEPKVRE